MRVFRLIEIFYFNCKDKIVATVSDHAANQLKAIRLCELISIGCCAHAMQLAINDALKSRAIISSLLAKFGSIVTHFKKSNTAQSTLKIVILIFYN